MYSDRSDYMKLKKMVGSFTAIALMMSMAGTAFADETADFFANFHPLVHHEIINADENSNHVLQAQANVTIPEGVSVDSGDFTWVITMAEDPSNPISDSIKDDSSKDETDIIADDNSSMSQTASAESSGDISFDNDIDNDGNAAADDGSSEDIGTLEGETYTSRVQVEGGTTITGACEVTFGLIIELDIPLDEDQFNIGLEASPSNVD